MMVVIANTIPTVHQTTQSARVVTKTSAFCTPLVARHIGSLQATALASRQLKGLPLTAATPWQWHKQTRNQWLNQGSAPPSKQTQRVHQILASGQAELSAETSPLPTPHTPTTLALKQRAANSLPMTV